MSVSPIQGAAPAPSGAPSQPVPTAYDMSIPTGASASPEAIAAAACMALGDVQISEAKGKVVSAQVRREAQIARARRALEEARKSQKKASGWKKLGSFAKTVAKYAAIAGTIAAAGATGGASLVGTAALLSVGTSAASWAMRKYGADFELGKIEGVPVRASDIVLVGGAVAAVFITGASAPGKGTVGGFEIASHHVAVGAYAVSPVAIGVSAVATEREGHHQAKATEHDADAAAHQNAAKRAAAQVEDAIDLIRAGAGIRDRALKAVVAISETRAAAMQAVVGRRA